MYPYLTIYILLVTYQLSKCRLSVTYNTKKIQKKFPDSPHFSPKEELSEPTDFLAFNGSGKLGQPPIGKFCCIIKNIYNLTVNKI